jgi:hypothetical protein
LEIPEIVRIAGVLGPEIKWSETSGSKWNIQEVPAEMSGLQGVLAGHQRSSKSAQKSRSNRVLLSPSRIRNYRIIQELLVLNHQNQSDTSRYQDQSRTSESKYRTSGSTEIIKCWSTNRSCQKVQNHQV